MENTPQDDTRYQARLAAEEAYYHDREVIHELPEIFHYWSNKYIRPKLQAVGFDSMLEFFTLPLQQQCDRAAPASIRFLSIGSGNCDLEIQFAEALVKAGRCNFVIDCLDINETMLARGRALAAERDLSDHIRGVAGDFNHWDPHETYHAVLAVQALHHVVNLEGLFQGIKRCLAPGGRFVIGDMIGRNGHRPWPEAKAIIHEYWRRLPPSYRYNHSLLRYEELLLEWDCSKEAFEGVRAQDILALLVGYFQFHCFVPYSNLIDPFVERTFGHNFDAAAEWDRAFIDEVQARDERELASGGVTPTHLFAIVGNDPPEDYRGTPDPARYIRKPDAPPFDAPVTTQSPYAWGTWPHAAQSQLAITCRHLAEASALAGSLQSDREVVHAHLTKLTEEFEARGKWALDIAEDIEAHRKWARELQQELDVRTNWALTLDKQLAEKNAYVRELTAQLAVLQKERAKLAFLPEPIKRLIRKLLS